VTSLFTASATIQTAAGAATLSVSFLLFREWLNVTMTSVGMSEVPRWERFSRWEPPTPSPD
jgi:hypothetical protein